MGVYRRSMRSRSRLSDASATISRMISRQHAFWPGHMKCAATSVCSPGYAKAEMSKSSPCRRQPSVEIRDCSCDSGDPWLSDPKSAANRLPGALSDMTGGEKN